MYRMGRTTGRVLRAAGIAIGALLALYVLSHVYYRFVDLRQVDHLRSELLDRAPEGVQVAGTFTVRGSGMSGNGGHMVRSAAILLSGTTQGRLYADYAPLSEDGVTVEIVKMQPDARSRLERYYDNERGRFDELWASLPIEKTQYIVLAYDEVARHELLSGWNGSQVWKVHLEG